MMDMQVEEPLFTKEDLELSPYDGADIIKTPEDVMRYLEIATEEAFADDDPQLISYALGVIARSQGMRLLAEKTGIKRESLYKSLSDKGNPRLETLFAVCKALGVRLSMVPLTPSAA